MRTKYDMPETDKAKLEKEQAFRLGYSAGSSGAVSHRDQCPLVSVSLRAQWKAGFDLSSTRGLKITLPKVGRR